jgi:hypothetical protein
LVLTLESAGALVPGRKPEDFMQERPIEAKVRVTRAFYVGKEVQEIGKVVTLPIRLAGEMVTSNKAEYVFDAYEPPVPKSSPAPDPKKPK